MVINWQFDSIYSLRYISAHDSCLDLDVGYKDSDNDRNLSKHVSQNKNCDSLLSNNIAVIQLLLCSSKNNIVTHPKEGFFVLHPPPPPN